MPQNITVVIAAKHLKRVLYSTIGWWKRNFFSSKLFKHYTIFYKKPVTPI